MDWKDTPEQAAFRKEVHDFIDKECPKELRGGDVSFFEQAGNLFAWRKKVAQKGWVAPAWPKECGHHRRKLPRAGPRSRPSSL